MERLNRLKVSLSSPQSSTVLKQFILPAEKSPRVIKRGLIGQTIKFAVNHTASIHFYYNHPVCID